MNSTRTTLHTSERSPNIANYGREELYDDPYAIGSKAVYQHSENIQS